jgi:hypothetical protein
MSLRTAAALLVFGLALAPVARGQHPLPRGPRPLHLRIAEADVVAVATIGPITEGRVEVRDAAVLRGSAPANFEIKRSPNAPPPFVTGVPAVLLLRGARSPYVQVDEPREVVLLRDANDAKRWSAALQALFDASADPNRLLHTYLIWLDGDDEGLREAAAGALSDFRASFVPLGSEDAVARARAAVDPHRAKPTRRVSAMLAMTNADGANALVAAMPGASADPGVVATALRAATTVDPDARSAALLRSLDSDDRDVRRAALFSAPTLWNDAVGKKVTEMSAHDVDPEVRADATDAKLRATATQ